MTPAAFRAHLEALCWSQRGFAVLLGVAHNTVHRWAVGQARIPDDVASWLEGISLYRTENPPPR